MALDDWQLKMMMKAFRPFLPIIRAELAGVDPNKIPIEFILDGTTHNFIEAMELSKNFDFQTIEHVRIEIKRKSSA